MNDDKAAISESTLRELVAGQTKGRGIYRTVAAGNSAGCVNAVLDVEELEELESRGINPFWDKKKF
ncbi:hypothetical protein FACS189434_05770 [Bacteroidia bacterium]|nr:hypothetical protein FACS189434_05770 [Bacteroidia bacterium]